MPNTVLPNGKGTGWIPSLPDKSDYQYMMPAFPFLPASVDLRDKLPSVRDQGPLGSCTAFAVLSLVEYDHIRQRKGDAGQEFSELFLYYEERAREGTIDYDSGAYIRDGIKVMAKVGCCHDPLWPYDIQLFTDKPPAAAYGDARIDRVLLYYHLPQLPIMFQSALAWGDMFVYGFTVYESFLDTGSDGIVPWPDFSRESVLGGHAVAGCGYETIGGELYILARNSWGPDFADHGYIRMPARYLADRGLASDFWVIRYVR